MTDTTNPRPVIPPPGGHDVRDWAAFYAAHGWWPVRIPVRNDGTDSDGKNPRRNGWEEDRVTPADAPRVFDAADNVGLLLGRHSGDLVDVDLDCDPAVWLAAAALPRTPMRHGRPPAKGASLVITHHWYVCPGIKQMAKLQDPVSGKVLVELRGNDGTKGLQSVVPPSLHVKTRGRLGWAPNVEFSPTVVPPDELLTAVKRLAGLCTLCLGAPPEGRHEWGMALCGWLARTGIPRPDALSIVGAVLAGIQASSRADEFAGMLTDAYDRLGRGEAVKGAKSLAEFIEMKRVQKAEEWLALPRRSGDSGGKLSGAAGDQGSSEEQSRFKASTRERLNLGLNDVGNGDRFVADHGAVLRFSTAFGGLAEGWLHWDGQRWRNARRREAYRLAEQTARGILEEAGGQGRYRDRLALEGWANQTLSVKALDQMIKNAASKPGIQVLPEDLDTMKYHLNVENGVLGLSTCEVLSHDCEETRSQLHTKLAPVSYDPQAGCPRWIAFLREIMGWPVTEEPLFDEHGEAVSPPPAPEGVRAKETDVQVAALARLFGLSLTGTIKVQKIFLCHGTGANGKSLMLNVFARILGDYARHTSSETLLATLNKNVSNNAQYELARLRGARFVVASEIDDGRRMAEGLVKLITGGEPVTARPPYGAPFEFTPEWKIWLTTNHLPVIRSTDHGIWRRMLVIPFTVTIPDERQDRDLEEKLVAEAPGILNWAVGGWDDLNERLAIGREPLNPPPQWVAATEQYRNDSDLVAQFVDQQLQTGPTFSCEIGKIYEAYKLWSEEAGHRPMSRNRLGRRLSEMGFEPDRDSTGQRIRRGVTLK